MKSIAVLVVLFMAALSIGGCASSDSSGGGSETIVRSGGATPADPEFRALIDGYYNAWSFSDDQAAAGAVDRAAQYYATDPDAVFYELNAQYDGWAEFKAQAMPNFMSQFVRTSFTPTSDLRVSRRGPVAWTTVTFRGAGVLRSTGETVHLDGRHTAIWNRRGRNWVIVHEHLSLPRQR